MTYISRFPIILANSFIPFSLALPEYVSNCFSYYIVDGRQVVECHGSGSPMYLAPETVLERPVSCAVDIWASGVILYLLLVSISTDAVVKHTARQFYKL